MHSAVENDFHEDSVKIGVDLQFMANERQSVLLPAHAGSNKSLQPLLFPAGAFLLLAMFVMFALNQTFTESDLIDDLQKSSPPHPLTCLGPPYLYVTIHDKVQNVLKYSRNGCLVDDSVLIMSEAYEKLNEVEFRSLAIGKHKDHDALFIADAAGDDSRLLIFGSCIKETDDYFMKNKRHFVQVVATRADNPGLDHSYGVCHDSFGNVYISNQHTNSVLRFKVNTWEPMELPASLQLKNRMDYFEGTFVQFGLPVHTKGQFGVRSLAHVGEKIWIAHEAMSAVLIADVKTGHVSDFVVVDTPIGLYHAKDMNLTFVSCKSKERGGIVYGINVNTLVIEKQYTHKHVVHPTGITSYAGILYVAEQKLGAILTFDIAKETYLGPIVTDGVKDIEQIALSPC